MSQPPMIPYVEYHLGPRRALVLTLVPRSHTAHAYAPIATIDGRSYLATWGVMTFEIPADRPVHLSVHLQSEAIAKVATALLPPGDGFIQMQYDTTSLTVVNNLR